MKNKIGVFICQCGGNISDYVDVEKVREAIKNEPGVAQAKHMMFTCADSSQKEMIEDIKKNKLDAMVVASCSPKLHLYTFRDVAVRAGINPYNYVQVNLREQCSWAHTDKPKDATEKGIGLVKAGIAKARNSEALEKIKIPSYNIVAVIGAGVAGMKASIQLADMGTNVYLIEKDYFVGGRPPQMQELFQTNETGKGIIENLYRQVKERENITLFTGAKLESLTGNIGNFRAKVKVKPRYVVPGSNKDKLKEAIENCANEVPDEFNFGLVNRKAIYKNYDTALPDIPVIDIESFKPDKKFLETYKECIDLNQKEETLELKTGAVLLCTGFDLYEPKEGEYGYKQLDNVITLHQFKRIIDLNENEELLFNGKEIKRIAYIYCVGSRQTKGENKYCSRFCCTAAIHSSVIIKSKYKNVKGCHLFRDIRTYGKQEILYNQARDQRDLFFKFNEEEPPVVEKEGDHTIVKIKDVLLEGEEVELTPDLVVLVTGMVPRKDSTEIANIVKAPIGLDKFFNEVHPKLRPVETVIDGVFIAGSCQGPKNITESVNSALSAAAKANSIISSGKIELEPIIATINKDTCEWCGKCLEVCDYDAITKTAVNGKSIAEVNIALCKGGGMCLPVCPVDAIEITGYTNQEIESMIDAINTEITIESEKDEIISEESGRKMKELPEIWNTILQSLEQEQKTISQIVQETDIPASLITYHIMTLVKYGYVNPSGMDDMDEYYYYELKK
ncbi:MAG: FAD-dependent oxidoreductase [Bacteroidales bacterium]|nr:FAD-dependent oxidoreductase [Bacteroidales bacterium]